VRSASSGGAPLRWGLAVAAWVAAVGGGFAALAGYQASPGAAAASEPVWPAGTALAAPGGPTLLVFLHPECACSRATLGELDRLLVFFRGRVDVRLVFSAPGRTLRERAARLSGVTPVDDPGGIEARRFGATTSGHAFLFAADGRRLFAGGITAARGHHGDNAGAAALRAHAEGREAPGTAPVFGCPLFAEEAE